MKIVVLDNNSHSYQLIYVCHQIEFQTNLKNEKNIFTKLKKKKKKKNLGLNSLRDPTASLLLAFECLSLSTIPEKSNDQI